MSRHSCGLEEEDKRKKTLAVRDTNLCNHKVGIIHDRVSLLDSLDRSWAGAVASSLRALLLWSSIHCLPPVKPGGEVRPSQPHLIPHVEVPEHREQMPIIILTISSYSQYLTRCHTQYYYSLPQQHRDMNHHAMQRRPNTHSSPQTHHTESLPLLR